MSPGIEQATTNEEPAVLQQLEDFFVNAPLGLQITDSDGTVRSANIAMLQIVGALDRREEFVGRNFADFFADPDLAGSLRDRVAGGARLNNVEAALRTADGSTCDVLIDVSGRFVAGEWVATRWFVRRRLISQLPSVNPHLEVHGAPGTNEDAFVWGAQLVNHDADDVLAGLGQEEKQARLEELEDFFEGAPAGVHFVGFNGLILRANRMELELLGYQDHRDEYVGHHVRKIHSNKAIVEDLLRRLVEGEPVINFRARLLRKDGESEPVIIYSGLRLKDGRFENTRCFLFSDHDPDAELTVPSGFGWPRND
ncbi:PAS domain-containing protein [Saccharothrix yanglingensis]|uniref:PAS domain-containing protein n=1 Tax=Saccharothrix yanglingensis TaxID=659496 RepID=UPI0027D211AF|nr:PAS domain-containing protein [Saccharothrix yanglingensis]